MTDNDRRTDRTEQFIVIFAVVSVVLGLVMIVGLLAALRNQYQLLGSGNVDVTATAQVGDFVGGFVGALWSLAGILLFYSSLRLQRKEFALQRVELRDQRQEFATTRVVNVIYRQLDNLSQKADKLRFTLSGNNVHSQGQSVVHDFHNWFINHFPNNEPARDEQKAILLKFEYFLLTEPTKEHLRYLIKTVEVCTNLIEQKEHAGDTGTLEYVLDEYARQQLHLLLDGNLDVHTNQLYLNAMKRTHMERETLMKRLNPNAAPIAFMYGHQQVKLINSLLQKLASISNASRQITKDSTEAAENTVSGG